MRLPRRFYCERVTSEGGGRTVAKGGWQAGPAWLSTWKGASTGARRHRREALPAAGLRVMLGCARLLPSSPSSLYFKQKRIEESAGSLDRVVAKMKIFLDCWYNG